jgi:hypothetical protein
LKTLRIKESDFFWELCLYILKTHHENHQLLGAITYNHSTLVLTWIFLVLHAQCIPLLKKLVVLLESGTTQLYNWLPQNTSRLAFVCIPPMCIDPNIQLFFPSIGNDAGCGNMLECCWIFTWYWGNDESPPKQISS